MFFVALVIFALFYFRAFDGAIDSLLSPSSTMSTFSALAPVVVPLFLFGITYVAYLFRHLFLVVPMNTVCVVERLGKNPKVILPGFAFIGWPLLDKIKEFRLTKVLDNGKTSTETSLFVPTREINYDIATMSLVTSDNVPIKVNTTLYIKIVDPKLFLYGFSDPGSFINDVCVSSFHTFLTDKTVSWILLSKAKIAELFKTALVNPLSECGCIVTRVYIQDVAIPEQLEAAYNEKVTSMVSNEAQLETQRSLAVLQQTKMRNELAIVRERQEQELQMLVQAAEKKAEADFLFERNCAVKMTGLERAAYLLALRQCEVQKSALDGTKSSGSTVYIPFDSNFHMHNDLLTKGKEALQKGGARAQQQ